MFPSPVRFRTYFGATLAQDQTDGKNGNREWVAVARRARWQKKALDDYFLGNFTNFLKKSHVRSSSGQRSKTSLFALSATETGLITAANPNSAERLPEG